VSDPITLQGGGASAVIAPLGAELRAWAVDGAPLIWTPDPAIWADTAPVLFPVVGWTRGAQVRVAGVTYPLGLHGFARTLAFRVVERGEDHVALALESGPETLALYPFAFRLVVAYRLVGATLRTTLAIENTGSAAMPYACGLHPGFRWPFAGGSLDDYAIVFAEPERPEVPVIAPDGLFTHDVKPIPLEGRRLALDADLLAHEALCLLDARSRALRFVHRDGAAITIALEGFPHIALWSRPEGRFLSIEAWTGRGDDIDGDGDLWRKPSMIHLAPGGIRRHAAVYGFAREGREP
jgi:galactose mutarotase-like enzyme